VIFDDLKIPVGSEIRTSNALSCSPLPHEHGYLNALQRLFLDFLAEFLTTHCPYPFHTYYSHDYVVLVVLDSRSITLRRSPLDPAFPAHAQDSTSSVAQMLFVRLCILVRYNTHPESPFGCSMVEAQCLEVTLTNVPR
jgi:hypothetical protein